MRQLKKWGACIMANVSSAMLAKSDQLNYDDFGGSEKIITIERVTVTGSEQPVSIFYIGHNGKPYKPSKGMIRLISQAWGDESDNWIGKSIKLYGDSSVKWAGQEIGGIRINGFSDIDKNGLTAFVALSRGKRRKTTVPLIVVEQAAVAEPDENAKGWIALIKADPAAIDQITDEQYKLYIQTLL